MGAVLQTVVMPIALGVVMFGLGLGLTVGDFRRVARQPKAVLVALGCQLILLPLIAFALVSAFQLPPVLAVGMMLIAASPGGTTANVFSHLFRGDIALNISLTAINAITAVVTLPIVVNLSLAYFMPEGGQIGLQIDKTIEVFLIVLGPVAVGMTVRRLWPRFALAMDRPVRIASVVILVAVMVGSIISNSAILLANLGSLAGIAVLLCLLSLLVGFFVPRLFRIDRPQAVASSFEIGIHNATLAIVIAQSVLGNVVMSLPPAVYGALSLITAFLFGVIVHGRYALRAKAGLTVTAPATTEPLPPPTPTGDTRA